MKTIEKIKKPIYQEMEMFEKKFSQSMSSKVALLNRITHFIVNRKGKQMRPMSMTLANNQAISDVSAYVSTLGGPASDPTIDGDLSAGKAAYAVCASCHGANGEGNDALNAPALTGQQDWYIARQLYNFKNGIRGTHENDVYGQQMIPMAMTLLDDAAINNVAAYISSLK